MTRLSPILRNAAARGQHGQTRTPASFYVGESYTSYYWSGLTWDMDFETWQRMGQLSRRYQRFVHYVREVLPAWRETGEKLYFADNSVEAVQVDRNGNTRRVMVTAPHGD